MMKWRSFMIAFLKNMSLYNPGTIYVLFGSQAQILEPYINANNYILKIKHPAYYTRVKKKMPNIWKVINGLLYELYREKIEWFKEEEF